MHPQMQPQMHARCTPDAIPEYELVWTGLILARPQSEWSCLKHCERQVRLPEECLVAVDMRASDCACGDCKQVLR